MTKQKYTAAEIAAMRDDELKIAIAEWRGLVFSHFPEATWNGGIIRFPAIYIDPAGEKVKVGCWPTDANAALELLKIADDEFNLHFYLYWSGEDWEAGYDNKYDNAPKWFASAPTAARAIAEAWLQWKQESTE